MNRIDYAHEQHLEDKYEEQLKEKAIKKHKENLKKDNIFNYFVELSSEKEGKIIYCIEKAELLYKNNFYNSSLINSAIAIELIIRYFLVSPIVQGAFLHREWAEILSERIIEGKTYKDREILPALLRLWDIEVTEERLENGEQFWESLINTIKARNNYVHDEKIISEEESEIALHTLDKLVEITETICQTVGYNSDLNN